MEPALNELPSNKWARKDDEDEGEESASNRPHPLTVDELPEPVNEVIQIKPRGGGGGKKTSSKNKK